MCLVQSTALTGLSLRQICVFGNWFSITKESIVIHKCLDIFRRPYNFNALAVGFPAQNSNDESFVVFVPEHSLLVCQCAHTS